MADERHFEQLLAEFRRVGIDPNTFTAMLAVNPDDARRALRVLPDDAGPAAFLAELRRLGGHQPVPEHGGTRSSARAEDGRASA